MKLSGKLDQKFLLLFLFVMIASPNYFIFGFGGDQVADNVQIGDISFDSLQFSSANSIFAEADKVISINGQNSIAQSGPVGSLATGNPVIALETATSDSKFSFVYNKSASGVDTQMANNTDFTVTPVDPSSYDRLEVEVDIYTGKNDYVIQDTYDGGQAIDFTETFAQGALIEQLETPANHTVKINGFNVTIVDFGPQNIPIIGEIWSADLNGTNLVPSKSLQSSTTLTTSADIISFEFLTPIQINSTNTHTNASGGYIFFVLTRDDGDSNNPVIRTASHLTYGDNGPTYMYTASGTGSPPTHLDNWTTAETFDFLVAYNVSYEFEPSSINTIVAGTPVDTYGQWYENAFHDASTAYRVTFNTSVYSLDTLINVSYTYIKSDRTPADVSYTVSPKLPELNWTISYDNSYGASDATISKYFLIPSNFTDVVVYSDTTLLSSPTHYELIPGSINQTLYMYVGGTVTFKVTANSTNQLFNANPINYVEDPGWIERDVGEIGLMHPSITVGDMVRNTIINIGSLDLTDGSVNSSLRTEDGTILSDQSFTGYTDGSPSSSSYVYGGSITFDTNLDPNIPVGVYSFQHIWFNGTAGGAIYEKFNVVPVTQMVMVTLTSLNIMEGAILNFEFDILDKSHNNSWTEATKNVEWDLEGNISSLAYDGIQTNKLHRYSGTIDLDVDSTPVEVQNYVVNITFSEGSYTDFLLFSFDLYYRGESGISGPITLEAESDLLLDFQVTNETVDGTGFNSSGVTLSANTSYTTKFNPADANHTITIEWNDAFRYGLNQITLNWSHPDFRTIADQNYTLFTYDFTVTDGSGPVFDFIPGATDQIVEGTTSNTITWNASDYYPGDYVIMSNRTGTMLEEESDVWTSAAAQIINIDGLAYGVYEYTITYTDEAANEISHSIIITVLDNLKPAIDQPIDIIDYLEESTGNILTWTVSDNHPYQYSITRNGITVVDNVAWVSGSIEYNMDGLLKGEYEFNITLYDESLNPISDIVAVTVLDEIDPTLTITPGDTIRVFENQTSLTLIWQGDDNNAYEYIVYANGTAKITDTWISGTNITYVIDDLALGVYNYTIIIFDTSDNFVTHTVILTVKDPEIIVTKQPEFSIIENIYEGTIETLDLSWFTENGLLIKDATVNLTIVVDSVNSSIIPETITYFISTDVTGLIKLVFNYTSLVPGLYHWIITFEKAGYETVTMTNSFQIHPHIVEIVVQVDDLLTQGEEFRISAKVTYNNPIALVLNGITSSRQGAITDLEIVFTIDFTTQTDDNSSLSQHIFTDENGIALWVISSELTAPMQSVSSISTEILSSGAFILPEIVLVPAAELPDVKETTPGLSDILNDIRDIIEEYLELFIAIVFVLLTTIVVVVFQVKRKRERTRLFDHLKLRTAEEMEGLLSINAIIIKSTYSGVPFYERVFEDAINIDLALLSGVTTAITSVLSEIQKNKEGFEIMQRSGLSITTHHGELTTYVIVSNEELPDIIRSQIEDAHAAFDEQYKHMADEPLLLNTIGRTPINQHISNYVKISLKENLKINDGVINKIQDKKSITRKIRSNLKTLMDLNVSIREAELPLTLYSLFEFLRAQGMDNEQIYQTISTANAHGIIESTEV